MSFVVRLFPVNYGRPSASYFHKKTRRSQRSAVFVCDYLTTLTNTARIIKRFFYVLVLASYSLHVSNVSHDFSSCFITDAASGFTTSLARTS